MTDVWHSAELVAAGAHAPVWARGDGVRPATLPLDGKVRRSGCESSPREEAWNRTTPYDAPI